MLWIPKKSIRRPLDIYQSLGGTLYEIYFSFTFWNRFKYYVCGMPIFLFKNRNIYWHILVLHFRHTFRRNEMSHILIQCLTIVDIEFTIWLRTHISIYWISVPIIGCPIYYDVPWHFEMSSVIVTLHELKLYFKLRFE